MKDEQWSEQLQKNTEKCIDWKKGFVSLSLSPFKTSCCNIPNVHNRQKKQNKTEDVE